MAENDTITTLLMFTGRAEEAMRFYTGLFADSRIEALQHYGQDAPGLEGQVVHARFRLNGQLFMAMDSPPVHAFTFTPSISFMVECPTAAEVDRLYAALSQEGAVLMELQEYPFARRYAWVQDRFGVSWQLMFA